MENCCSPHSRPSGVPISVERTGTRPQSFFHLVKFLNKHNTNISTDSTCSRSGRRGITRLYPLTAHNLKRAHDEDPIGTACRCLLPWYHRQTALVRVWIEFWSPQRNRDPKPWSGRIPASSASYIPRAPGSGNNMATQILVSWVSEPADDSARTTQSPSSAADTTHGRTHMERSQKERKKGARPRDPKIPHRLSTPDSKRGAPHLSPTPRKEVPASSFRPFPLGGGGFCLEAVRFEIGQRPPVALGSVECQAGGPKDLTYSPSILYG